MNPVALDSLLCVFGLSRQLNIPLKSKTRYSKLLSLLNLIRLEAKIAGKD